MDIATQETSTYGHCLTANPYRFVPDTQTNSDAELISWRDAVKNVIKGNHRFDDLGNWGLGITARSRYVNIWEEYKSEKFILDLAESDVSNWFFLRKVRSV